MAVRLVVLIVGVEGRARRIYKADGNSKNHCRALEIGNKKAARKFCAACLALSDCFSVARFRDHGRYIIRRCHLIQEKTAFTKINFLRLSLVVSHCLSSSQVKIRFIFLYVRRSPNASPKCPGRAKAFSFWRHYRMAHRTRKHHA